MSGLHNWPHLGFSFSDFGNSPDAIVSDPKGYLRVLVFSGLLLVVLALLFFLVCRRLKLRWEKRMYGGRRSRDKRHRDRGLGRGGETVGSPLLPTVHGASPKLAPWQIKKRWQIRSKVALVLTAISFSSMCVAVVYNSEQLDSITDSVVASLDDVSRYQVEMADTAREVLPDVNASLGLAALIDPLAQGTDIAEDVQQVVTTLGTVATDVVEFAGVITTSSPDPLISQLESVNTVRSATAIAVFFTATLSFIVLFIALLRKGSTSLKAGVALLGFSVATSMVLLLAFHLALGVGMADFCDDDLAFTETWSQASLDAETNEALRFYLHCGNATFQNPYSTRLIDTRTRLDEVEGPLARIDSYCQEIGECVNASRNLLAKADDITHGLTKAIVDLECERVYSDFASVSLEFCDTGLVHAELLLIYLGVAASTFLVILVLIPKAKAILQRGFSEEASAPIYAFAEDDVRSDRSSFNVYQEGLLNA